MKWCCFGLGFKCLGFDRDFPYPVFFNVLCYLYDVHKYNQQSKYLAILYFVVVV